MNEFAITIRVKQEPGQPDVYRLEAPKQPLDALYEIFRKLTDDLLIRRAMERTLIELANEGQRIAIVGPDQLPRP